MAKTSKQKKAPARSAPAKSAAPDRGALREVAGILMIGLGMLLTFFLAVNSGTGAGSFVGELLYGLAGSLRYLIPAILIWVGILLCFSSKQSKPNPLNVVLLLILVLSVCAGVHLFKCNSIVSGMTPYNYKTFIAKSIAYRQGGAGFFGALLSWPLYHGLGAGVAGSLIALIMIIAADLVLLRKISLRQLGQRVSERVVDYREQRNRSRAEQMTMNELPPHKAKRGEGKRADLDELEMWPDQAPPAQKPERVEKAAAPREMDIPKFAGQGPVLSSRRKPAEKADATRPVEAEQPDGSIDEVPDFLQRNMDRRKPRNAEAVKLHVQEPRPVRLTDDGPEPAPEGVYSGGVQFPVDEQEQWPQVGIGDALYGDGDVDLMSVPPEDDEPPFDLPMGEAPAPDLPVMRKKSAPRTIAAMPLATPASKKGEQRPAEEEPYNYPPIDLLQASTPSKVKNQEQLDEEKAKTLVATLASFGISARLIGIAHGPTVTRFELSPAAGIKVSRITSLADDIALNLAAVSVRIEAPIPGKAAVGVEVPNDTVEIVPLRDVLESNEARRHPSRLATALGRDNAGRYIVGDIAKMPHVLIAGATGAGKSVCINSLICSILYRATPEEVRLIMIDPKVVELSAYNGIPHLLVPVVTDPKKAASALEWAVSEMTTRYKKFAELGVRDMKGYNQRRQEGEPPMPQIVIIIDELADLMMVTPGEVEDAICRLAQLARAAGIHLVIATQRPSVNVITGVIKANIPSRIAFTVASQVDSRTILDIGGAEKLLGRGDMLYAPSGTNKPLRVQGAWVSDDEVHAVVEYVKDLHQTAYDEDLKEHIENAELSDAEREDALSEFDELLPQAVEICVEAGQASISMLQRRLRVGYARAGRLIDEMAARGVISQAEGAKPRTMLMTKEQFRAQYGE